MRYLVFAYDNYYPCGGWSDHKGSFATEAEAIDAVRELIKKYDHAQVADVEAGTHNDWTA